MAKRKKRNGKITSDTTSRTIPGRVVKYSDRQQYTFNIYNLRHGKWASPTLIKRRFIEKPAIYVRTPRTKKIPPILPIGQKDKQTKLYSGFQTAERVTSCDLKRERRRRAYFGYINAPRAGSGAAKIRKSPRSDRFTVKC